MKIDSHDIGDAIEAVVAQIRMARPVQWYATMSTVPAGVVYVVAEAPATAPVAFPSYYVLNPDDLERMKAQTDQYINWRHIREWSAASAIPSRSHLAPQVEDRSHLYLPRRSREG